jgi:hypothetical protein
MNTLLRIAPAAVCARLLAASLVVANVLPARAVSDREGAPATPRVLNNFTTELLRLSRPTLATDASWRFTQPRTGWVWVRSEATLQGAGTLGMVIEPLKPKTPAEAQQQVRAEGRERWVLRHDVENPSVQEAMRFLPADDYGFTCVKAAGATLDSVIIRAIPELIFCKFQYDPLVPPHGPYDWAFLEKHVLAHINCLVGSGVESQAPLAQQWKQRGGRWIVECGVPALDGKQPLTADEAFAYWSQNPGFQTPHLDGVVADEFLGHRPGMKYPEWTEAVRRIHADPRFRGRFFYPYCTAIYRDAPSAEFLRVVMDSGFPFAWEVYLQEQPDLAQAQRHLQARLSAEMRRWREALPGCERHMIVCLGYMSLPTTETLNINPQVDYKVWMDLQFEHLATRPEFRGLHGLMEYTSGYADDETVRWAARLYRHYGIEGKTNRLSDELGFSYRLDHLENADFANGTAGWLVDAAEPGSVATKSLKGYGWLQGRYPRTSLGDTFLWTKRSATRPNRVTQQIRNLRPGQLYSLKLVTADYQELERGKSVQQKHAVGLQITPATTIREKSFQQPMANNYAHALGPFNDQNQAWMNYHYLVFRAEGQSATLTLSDWSGARDAGGPAGQELIYNFVEVQPYLEL